MVISQLDLKDKEQFIDLLNSYKDEIGEDHLDEKSTASLINAVQTKQICFYVVKDQDELVGMCSVCKTFSTYHCSLSGILEDFYIKPACRHQGIARNLITEVFRECRNEGILSLWVGSADVDVKMYKSLGFDIPLGNLLAWNSHA